MRARVDKERGGQMTNIAYFCAGAVVTLALLAVLVGYSALVVAGKADESAGDK